MELRQSNAQESAIAAARKRGDVALRYCGGPYGYRFWAQQRGVLILRRWRGKVWPRPFRASAVGYVRRPATVVSAMAGATYSNSTVYWHGVDKVSGGGVVTPVPVDQARCAVWGGSGYVGRIPNLPLNVAVQQFESNKARVTWGYNPLNEQAVPERFDVFSDGGTGAMDWSTIVASVTYVAGQRRYAWLSGVLAGGRRLFNVRARSAAGVYSLVPELRDKQIGALGQYTPVSGTNGALVEIDIAAPAAPVAPNFG